MNVTQLHFNQRLRITENKEAKFPCLQFSVEGEPIAMISFQDATTIDTVMKALRHLHNLHFEEPCQWFTTQEAKEGEHFVYVVVKPPKPEPIEL